MLSSSLHTQTGRDTAPSRSALLSEGGNEHDNDVRTCPFKHIFYRLYGSVLDACSLLAFTVQDNYYSPLNK